MKLCVTLVIVAALKVQNGVENLWKRGDSDGFEPHADFGQYLPENYMKAFIAGFPFLFCDKKYWYENPKDLPWEVFLPFVGEWNEKRNKLLQVLFLILDESMFGWRPKTSATGGLPNITNEPRKPVDLGTMACNGAKCKTGIMAYQDIVEDLTNQRQKKYLVGDDTKSHMPKGEDMYAHTAECLRQAKGAKLEEGGGMGGDAWFGSVSCAVELMIRYVRVYSQCDL